MPYLRKTTVVGNRIYRKHVYSARYGRKTIPAPKKNLTKDSVKEQQKRERIQKLNWMLELNFVPGDWHVTLTFRKELRTTDMEKLKAIKAEFFRGLRKYYKSQKTELKYIIVLEKLKTCVHYHVILNNVDGLSKELVRIWSRGRVYMTPLYESQDGFKQLASYVLKESSSEDRKKGSATYSRSRNLILPETKTEVVKARSWRAQPKPPAGYYLDKESLYNGIDQRGYIYQCCVFVKLDRQKGRGKHEHSGMLSKCT